MQVKSLKILVMICVLSVNGVINGQCLLTQTDPGKLKKSFFMESNNSVRPGFKFHPKHLGLILDDILNFKEHSKGHCFSEKAAKTSFQKKKRSYNFINLL